MFLKLLCERNYNRDYLSSPLKLQRSLSLPASLSLSAFFFLSFFLFHSSLPFVLRSFLKKDDMRGGDDRTEENLSLFQDMRNREKQKNGKVFTMPSVLIQSRNGGRKTVNESVDDDMLSSDLEGKNDYDWLLTPPQTPILSMDLQQFNSGCSLAAQKQVSPWRDSKSQTITRSSVNASFSSQTKSSTKPSPKMDKRHLSPRPMPGVKPSSVSSANVHLHDAKANGRSSWPSVKPNSGVTNAHNHDSLMMNARSQSPLVHTARSQSPLVHAARSQSPLAHSRASPSLRQATPMRQSTPLRQGMSPDSLVRSSSANDATSSSSSSRTTIMPSSTSPMKSMQSRRSLSNSRGNSGGGPYHGADPGHTSAHPRWLSRSSTSDVHEGNQGTKPKNVSSRSTMMPNMHDANRGVKPNEKMANRTPPATGGLGSKLRDKISQNLRRVKPSSSQGEVHAGSGIRKALKPTLRNNKPTIGTTNPNGNQALEVVLQRMDTCKSASSSGLRAFMSNISLSSLHSIQCGKKGAVPMSSLIDSPMATSSTASTDQTQSTIVDPEGSIDESLSERGSRTSVASRNGLSLPEISMYSKESHITNWLGDHDYGKEDVEIMQIFEQRLASLSGGGTESPLINELDGTIELDNFCLDSMPW